MTCRALIIAALLSAPAFAHDAQPPAAPAATARTDLAAPPATGATTYSISSVGGPHGSVTMWQGADGIWWAREKMVLRGFTYDLEHKAVLAADGTLQSLAIRGSTPSGDAAEAFALANGRATWTSPVDRGEAATPGLYVPFGGLAFNAMRAAEALHRAPNRTLALLPSGRATLSPLATHEVTANGQTKTLTAFTVDGVSMSPQPIWFDGDRAFGIASFLNFLPEGWESVAPELSRVQEEALAARAPALMAKLAKRPAGPVVFQNIRIYDSEARAFRENMTVVAQGGRITEVRPGGGAPVRLANATVFDGAGKTLVPGMWDAHMHYGDDLTGPLLLASGITSVRDPGNRPEESIARKKRIDSGQLLGPHVIPVMLIDGPGEFAAQMAVTATDEASAVAVVRKAHAMGFAGVKLYGSLDKRLVAPIAAEAKRLGLRVQGHLPTTMRPLEAVRAGYSELTHINMAMMQAMPDAVVAGTNNMQRFYGPGRYAKDVDLNSPEMKAYVAELKSAGTVVDPTLAIFEGGYTRDTGDPAPSYAAYDGLLPPVMARGLKDGGFAATPDVSRADMRASFKKLQEFTVALYRAGIPIVAGTDGAGPEMIRDLELYVAGGLTPGEALATATIVPAQVFGLDDRGVIAVGKRSDLVLIDGDPSRDIGALRHVEKVMLGDALLDGDELRSAAGITGRPK